eukprot:gene30803-37215_t
MGTMLFVLLCVISTVGLGRAQSLNEVLRKVAKSLHERNEELQNLVTPISSEGAVQAVVCKFDGSKPAHADIVQNEE